MVVTATTTYNYNLINETLIHQVHSSKNQTLPDILCKVNLIVFWDIDICSQNSIL